jgi:hypothetical protein
LECRSGGLAQTDTRPLGRFAQTSLNSPAIDLKAAFHLSTYGRNRGLRLAPAAVSPILRKAQIKPPLAGQIGGIVVAWRITHHATINWLDYG